VTHELRDDPRKGGGLEPSIDHGTLARRLTLPVIGLVVLCAAAAVGLVGWAAHKQDATYLAQEQHFVVYELDEKVESLSRLAKDFTWYDLAIEKLFTRFDVRFAEDTMGSYLASHHDIHATIVLDRDDRVVFMALDGHPVEATQATTYAAAMATLATEARDAPINEPVPASAFLRLGDEVVLAVASAFTPAYNNGRVQPRERGVLMLVQSLDPLAIPNLTDGTAVIQAHFAEGAPAGGTGVPVTAADGTVLGAYTWEPSRPSIGLIERLAAPLGALALVMAVLIVLFRRSVRGVIARLAADQAALEQRGEALATSERRYSAILERVADAVVIADGEGRITACNPAAGRLFGFDSKELPDRHADELLTRDGDNAPEGPAALLEGLVRDNAECGTVSLMARRRDGSFAVIAASAARVDAGDDSVYALMLRDVTERHRAEETLDLLATGTIVVTAGARVLLANRSAERLLRRGNVLRIENGRLSATDPWHEKELQKLVDQAIEPGVVEPMAGIGVMNIASRAVGDTLHLIVSPLREAEDGATPAAAIIVRDRAAQTAVNPAFLRRLYGLTPAESRVVAELAKGKRLQEVADGLQVSLNTVRNQLKQAFTKTHTNRQSDLVSLVLTSVADLDLEDPANEVEARDGTTARGPRG
jgi:PAS domain S-box-containing protein